MAKGDFLGEFEIYVMLALAHLDPEAYGVTIRQEITRRTGREIAIGAVYATLSRLEGEGARRLHPVRSPAGAGRPDPETFRPDRGRASARWATPRACSAA